MKTKIILIILIGVILLPKAEAQSWWDNTYSSRTLDANRIIIGINNIGGLDYKNADPGAFWNYYLMKHDVVWDQGLWVVGKIDDQIHLAFKQWPQTYSPGPIINNDAAMNAHPEDSTKFRVYKIGISDTLNPTRDYLEWPEEFGAPVSEFGYPLVYNDQTLWTVYNAMDSSLESRNQWNSWTDTLPIFPIEIRSIVYPTKAPQPEWLSDVVFFEWIVINNGQKRIDSIYLGLWTDIDFNNSNTNYPAVDSTIQLGYCWSNEDSGGYNFIPMSVGYILKYGPIISSPGDSAIFSGSKKIDYKNLNLSSFHGIGDDSSINPLVRPARSIVDAWNIARGYDAEGNVIIDPTTGLPTKFPFGGDPVTNTGYLYNYATGGGAGFVYFSGPINLAQQDTQWVMAVLLVSTGIDYKDAIVNLREKANIIQSMSYDQLVQKNSFVPKTLLPPKEFLLSQNFPNPFNNETKILFDIPYRSRVVIKVYDILGSEVRKIFDEEKEPNHYEVAFNGEGLASGVYFYQIYAKGEHPGEFLQTKKMILLK